MNTRNLVPVGIVALAIGLSACGGGHTTPSAVSSVPATQASQLAPTSVATTVAPATTTPTKVGTRSNPVPLGEAYPVTENGAPGWTVKVISVTPEASDPVAGAPPAGYLFDIVSYQLTRTGSTPEAPIQVLGDLIANNVARSVDTTPICYGGTPDNDDVYQNGTVNTSDCISVPAVDQSSLVLSVTADFGLKTTYFATH